MVCKLYKRTKQLIRSRHRKSYVLFVFSHAVCMYLCKSVLRHGRVSRVQGKHSQHCFSDLIKKNRKKCCFHSEWNNSEIQKMIIVISTVYRQGNEIRGEGGLKEHKKCTQNFSMISEGKRRFGRDDMKTVDIKLLMVKKKCPQAMKVHGRVEVQLHSL